MSAAAAAAVVGGIALTWHAVRWAPYHPVLRQRRLEVPPTWPAVEILHLTDLHLRRSDPQLFESQKRALGRLTRRPDLVCVTGDLCERVLDVPLVADLLRLVQPRYGTYVVLGNHEYGASSPRRLKRGETLLGDVFGRLFGPSISTGVQEGNATAVALGQLGVSVLRNEGRHLQIGDRSLWLGGVDDGWAQRADVAAAMRDRRAEEGALVLIHEPELAFPAVEQGADLVLAGHTHGGQVRLPIIGAPYWHRLDARLTTPAGMQTIGQAQLHISAGLGQQLPLRFRCPPEMVWLDCIPAGATGRHATRSPR